MPLELIAGSFIELTWKSSDAPVLININSITSINRAYDPAFTKVTYAYYQSMTANESYEDIKEAIMQYYRPKSFEVQPLVLDPEDIIDG